MTNKLFPSIELPVPPAAERNAAEIMQLCNQFTETLVAWYSRIQKKIFHADDGTTPEEINAAMGPAAGGVKLAGDILLNTMVQLLTLANLGRETPLELSAILASSVYPLPYDMTVNKDGTVTLVKLEVVEEEEPSVLPVLELVDVQTP